MRLRVAAYNVHGFRSGVRRVGEILRREEVDVALLTEARRWWLGRLARRLGMSREAGHRLRGGVPNAVLVRPPWRIVGSRLVLLSPTPGFQRRGALVVRAGHRGMRLSLVCVHLGLSEAERVRHAAELTDLLGGTAGPIVVAGDLNEDPEGPAVRWIGGRYWDAFEAGGEGTGPTFPASDPEARIDYVFCSGDVEVAGAWVSGDSDASDHLAVVADLEIG